MVQQLSYTGF